jgi:hypothetical protein
MSDNMKKLRDDLFSLGCARGNVWLQRSAERLTNPVCPPTLEDVEKAKELVLEGEREIESMRVAEKMLK